LFAFNEERFDRQPQQTQKTCDFFLLKKKKEKQRQKRARMFTIAPARVVPSKPGINARSRSRKIASRRECVLSEKKRPFVSRESIELRAIGNSDDDAPLQKETGKKKKIEKTSSNKSAWKIRR
jgi:DNA-binding helix-hairpin-helix protein with protein kinase domain